MSGHLSIAVSLVDIGLGGLPHVAGGGGGGGYAPGGGLHGERHPWRVKRVPEIRHNDNWELGLALT